MATRNYALEYKNYGGTEEQKKNRAMRNAARRDAEKRGLVRKGDGNDVAHVKALSRGGSNSRSNVRVEPAGQNRSFARNADGSMKSETSKSGR